MIGQTFGKWTVIGEVPRRPGAHLRVLVRCACGRECERFVQHLLTGQSTQCRWCRSVTHEATIGNRSREYRSWESAKQRCHNPSDAGYARYGGRGIVMHPRWRGDFVAFRDDMGPCPPGRTLDRVDVNGHYEPGNCRWATPLTQARNRRDNLLLTLDGTTLCVTEWAERTGLREDTIRNRAKHGWTDRAALTFETTRRGRSFVAVGRAARAEGAQQGSSEVHGAEATTP